MAATSASSRPVSARATTRRWRWSACWIAPISPRPPRSQARRARRRKPPRPPENLPAETKSAPEGALFFADGGRSGDQDRPVVVDVGPRGPGHHEVAERREEAVAVVRRQRL